MPGILARIAPDLLFFMGPFGLILRAAGEYCLECG